MDMFSAPVAEVAQSSYLVNYAIDRNTMPRVWIIDRQTALTLAEAVNLTTWQILEEEKDPLEKFKDLFLEDIEHDRDAITSLLPVPLYKLSLDCLLLYVKTNSFTWSVTYEDEQEYTNSNLALQMYVWGQEAQHAAIGPESQGPAHFQAATTMSDGPGYVDTSFAARQAMTSDREETVEDLPSHLQNAAFTPDFYFSLDNEESGPIEDSTTQRSSNEQDGHTDGQVPASKSEMNKEVDWDAFVRMDPSEAMDYIANWNNDAQAVDLHQHRSPSLDIAAALERAVLGSPTAAEPSSAQEVPVLRSRIGTSSKQAFASQTEFERIGKTNELDFQAARYIIAKVKILAIRAAVGTKRYSIQDERQAIQKMPINSALRITTWEGEKLDECGVMRRAVQQFDQHHRRRTSFARPEETVERALLLVGVRLLRHAFIYGNAQKQGKPRIPGKHYAADFDSQVPPNSFLGRSRSMRYTSTTNQTYASNRRSKALCRMIVACGHPCILVILVRLSNRLGKNFMSFLDELPLQQFCHWIATGRVSTSRLRSNGSSFVRHGVKDVERLETDLLWLHEHVLLHLLAVAETRMDVSLPLFDGSVTCNPSTCLTSIVPHSLQASYAKYLLGQRRNDQWDLGCVMVEGPSGWPSSKTEVDDHRESKSSVTAVVREKNLPKDDDDITSSDGEASEEEVQYSIRTDQRTFIAKQVCDYLYLSPPHFHPPPAFLVNQVLDLTDTHDVNM